MNIKKTILSLIIVATASLHTTAQQLNVATFNLRGDDARDVGNEWSGRKFMVTDQFKKYQLDLIGLQETNANMAGYLTGIMPQYDSIGVFAGIGTGILYNKERLLLKEHGVIWLSATPDTISKGWDAKYKRACVWGKFKDKASGKDYYFFNSHFDHIGTVARTNSAQLIVQRIRQMTGNTPVVMLGDLNTTQYDPNYRIFNNTGILKDCYDLAIDNHEKERGTGNGFNINRRQRIRVDHIFLSHTLQAYEYDVLTELYNNHTTSDHYGVRAIIGPKENDLGDLYRQFPEDFEDISPIKTSYGPAKVAAHTGNWIFDGTILGGSANNDRPTSGTYAARMVNGNPSSVYLQMDFDITDGASKVSVQHGLYGTDSVCRWQLEYSTNQGSSWKPTGPVVVTHQGNKQEALFIMDLRGKVRFRINKLGLGNDNNGRLSIDDFTIYKRRNTGTERTDMTLLAWQFNKPSYGGNEENATSSFNNKALNSSVLTRGAGLVIKTKDGANVRMLNGYAAVANAATSNSTSDTSAAISGQQFLTFTLNPAKTYRVSLSTLDVRLMATGKNRKVLYWKYSLDGNNFKFLAKAYDFTGMFPTSQHTINLSVHPDLQDMTDSQTVYFRLYVNGLDGGEELIGIGSSDKNISNSHWDKDYSLQLNGTVERVSRPKK